LCDGRLQLFYGGLLGRITTHYFALMLIVTFNTRSYCVLLRFTFSRGIALEA